MFRYVLKEKAKVKGKDVERAIVGSNNFNYIKELYYQLLIHQERKLYEISYYTIDKYEKGKIIECDIMF